MKSEELLNSLDYIGDDLLADAEQNVLVRTHRPWFKNAVAAVLTVAVGVGGFFALSKFAMKPSTPATEPQESRQIVNPDTLPTLEIGDSWQFLPNKMYPISDNCPALYDPSITSLPVYQSKVQTGTSPDVGGLICTYYSEEQLQTILHDAAIHSEWQFTDELTTDQSNGEAYMVTGKTSFGDLSVKGDGELIAYYYGENVELHETNEDLLDITGEPMKEHLEELSNQLHDELHLPQYENILFSDQIAYYFPTKEDPTEQLLTRSFDTYRAYLPNYNNLSNVYWYQHPGSSEISGQNQDWLELQGWYPLITLEEAKAQVLEGHYLGSVEGFSITANALNDVQLVYPLQNMHVLMIPYYQFCFLLGQNRCESICVPAIRPEYLSDWPEQESDPHDPVDTDPTDEFTSEPNPTDVSVSLSEDYFTALTRDSGVYFSNGLTEIWMQDNDVLKKDLNSGELETLFTLASEEGITTRLVGVTENRLYFGWNETEDWWGVNVYSVDYHGESRREIASDPQDVVCQGGWIQMVSFHTDVRQYTLKVIDRNDETVVDVKECWASAVTDDALYYIYVPALQDWDEYGMDEAERDALLQHVQYDVCRVNADSSIETLGSIELDFDSWMDYHNNFPSIDLENKEIIFYDSKASTKTRLDLSTMKSKANTVWSGEETSFSNLVEDYVTLEFAAVPYLNAQTEGANEINAEICEKYAYLQNWSESDEVWSRISYEEVIWQDVVSIIIKSEEVYDFTDYEVYCYDHASGLRLDTAAVLEKMGISQDGFLEECHARFKEHFEEENAYMSEQTRELSGYYDMLAQEDECVNMDLMVYPDKNGQLVVIAPIVNFAGAAYHYTPLPLAFDKGN